MKSFQSISKEELEIVYESVIRQLNVGLKKEKIISNIQDKGYDYNSAIQIFEGASNKFLGQVENQNVKTQGIESKELIKPLIGGLFCATIGGIIWTIVYIITKQSFLWLILMIGILSGIGTYEFARRKGLVIFRIIAGLISIFGFFIGKLAAFVYFGNFSSIQFSNNFFSGGQILEILWLIIAIMLASIVIPRSYLSRGNKSFFIKMVEKNY